MDMIEGLPSLRMKKMFVSSDIDAVDVSLVETSFWSIGKVR